MWKPGSAAPNKKASDSRRHSEPSSLGRRTPPMQAMNGGGGDGGSSGRAANRNRNSSDGIVRTPPTNGGGGPPGTSKKTHSGGAAKKLSGATLGMRFMQRKAEAEAAAERRRRAEEEAKVAASREEQVTTTDSSKRGDAKKGASDEGEPMEVDSDGLATTKNIGMPQLATDADMYGAEADIIGRRSFGGFNRAVGETWKAALQMRRKSDADAAAGKKPISDEELLRRYEKYVRGEDDGPDVDRASAAPIGNLAEKVKNKNRQQASPRRMAGGPHGSGQKRRRRDDRMR